MNGLDRDRWNALWRTAGAAVDGAPPFEELMRLYAQPYRRYHNAQHIRECLREFDAARPLAHQPAAVEMAIWFHDAIYDPRASDNEERSAELARKCLAEARVSVAFQDCVVRLVMATKQHDGSLDPDAPLMVDIDLSIFGQSGERFWEYEEQIRAEYDWVPGDVFTTKRAEILERFLARPRIYATDHFFQRYEQPARANLTASVSKLRGYRLGVDKR